MTRTPLMLLLSIFAGAPAFAQPSRSVGPQPYLLFNFHIPDRVESRMLSADTRQFTYTARPRNFWMGRDTVTVQAKLLKKTSKGFRFSWSVAHFSHGRVTTTLLVPWTKDPKLLYSVPGFEARCFYSNVPVEPVEIISLIDLTKRSSQPLAVPMRSFQMTSTPSVPFACALGGGRSAFSR